MAILSCHVSIKLPPKISDGQELLTRFSSLKRRSAQGLVSIPFIASTILMRFSQLSSQFTRRPRRKTPASVPPMDFHGTQHVQPRPELPVVIGKCLFQDTVDGELSRIEEALLRDPRNVSQLFLNVH